MVWYRWSMETVLTWALGLFIVFLFAALGVNDEEDTVRKINDSFKLTHERREQERLTALLESERSSQVDT